MAFESRVEFDYRSEKAFDALFGRQREGYASHRLIWSLFADAEGPSFTYAVVSERPFVAIVRSDVPPVDGLGCWKIETRPLRQDYAAGTVLAFRLRVNATKTQVQGAPGEKRRGKRMDPAKHAWLSLPPERRAEFQIGDMAEMAGLEWLQRQGTGYLVDGEPLRDQQPGAPPHGFRLLTDRCQLDRDYPFKIRRPEGNSITYTVYEFSGLLEVTDPERFGRMLLNGVGRGRRFGLGMMAVAPASVASLAA